MDDDTRASLTALFGAAVTGEIGPWIAGVTGVARPRAEWDVATSAHAPALTGDEITFAALADGRIVVRGESPEAVEPLARVVERHLDRPYRAGALRRDGDLWAVAAARATVVELVNVDGDHVDAARVGDGVTFSVDGEQSLAPLEVRSLLAAYAGDVAITADRLDGTTWIAEVWRL